MLRCDWLIRHPHHHPDPELELNHSMLTMSFPKANGHGKKDIFVIKISAGADGVPHSWVYAR
jgi:hypothetical protein